MKSKTQYLYFNTKTRIAFVNITDQVQKLIEESKIKEGFCLVNAMHITSSVFVNDNESGEYNADAHLKRQIMGREVVVAVTDGKLDFGPWEQIFYGEFDGRRNKRVLVKV